MPGATKHPIKAGKNAVARRLEPVKKRTAARKASASRAEDLASRKKIGKTLDLEAFDSEQKRSSASAAAHWETPE
jgi:hypothetical protein